MSDRYDRCPSCGAEIYADGTHLLDRYDRAGVGYPDCRYEPLTGAILASLALAPRDEHGEVIGEGW